MLIISRQKADIRTRANPAKFLSLAEDLLAIVAWNTGNDVVKVNSQKTKSDEDDHHFDEGEIQWNVGWKQENFVLPLRISVRDSGIIYAYRNCINVVLATRTYRSTSPIFHLRTAVTELIGVFVQQSLLVVCRIAIHALQPLIVIALLCQIHWDTIKCLNDIC